MKGGGVRKEREEEGKAGIGEDEREGEGVEREEKGRRERGDRGG